MPTLIESGSSRIRLAIALCAVGVIAVTAWNIRVQLHDWKGAAPFQIGSVEGQAFDLSSLTISTDQVRSGGPPKDGIPSLTDPKFVVAGEAKYLESSDSVIGIVRGDDARAYPLRILDLHEIVNDTVGGVPIAVTYCPLCDSSVVFDRRIEGEERELGVSGKLYNSNVLMFDRQQSGTESLLSQLLAAGISGPLADTKLKRLPLEVTTWQAWQTRYPAYQGAFDRHGTSTKLRSLIVRRLLLVAQTHVPRDDDRRSFAAKDSSVGNRRRQ